MTSLNPWRDSWLIARKAVAKLRRRLVNIPRDPAVRMVNGKIRFEHQSLPFLDEGDIRAMLTGSYDIILCDYLKHHLKPGDVMLDVGANVGYISAIAASCVGPLGEVHGFEPLFECFARLERLRVLNPEYALKFNNVALGESEGALPIVFDPAGDSRNASLVPGKHSALTREVPVHRLDRYIAENISAPERIKLIKIDVEGFEYSVLRGLDRFLSSHTPLIVCEIKPWELRNLGTTPAEFDAYMKSFGYRSYVITEPDKVTDIADLKDMEVLVFRR